MKKKFLGILICCILLLGMTGCGKNSNNLGEKTKDEVAIATIVDNNGETKTMTAKELADIYESNEANFKKNYTGAKITLTGTVESIKEERSAPSVNGKTVFISVYKISLNEGWEITINKENNEDLVANFEKGDKILVESDIAMGWSKNTIRIFSVKRCSENEVCFNSLGWPEYEYLNNSTIVTKVN